MKVRNLFSEAVCKRWLDAGVVASAKIKRKVFVTTTVDNTDEPGHYKLHGTAIF